MTFGTYATSWIETWPLKEQTRERYRGILRRELMPVFGGYPLAKIHAYQVRAWLHEQNVGPLSASSVRQHIAVLRSCLKAAQIDGHLGELPLLGVKMSRSYSRKPAVLTLTEAFAMIDAASAAWQCAIATSLFTGLRLGELLALTAEDVDLPGRASTSAPPSPRSTPAPLACSARSRRAAPASARSPSSRSSPRCSRTT